MLQDHYCHCLVLPPQAVLPSSNIQQWSQPWETMLQSASIWTWPQKCRQQPKTPALKPSRIVLHSWVVNTVWLLQPLFWGDAQGYTYALFVWIMTWCPPTPNWMEIFCIGRRPNWQQWLLDGTPRLGLQSGYECICSPNNTSNCGFLGRTHYNKWDHMQPMMQAQRLSKLDALFQCHTLWLVCG